MPEVLIVPTGTANLASVAAAFRRLGVLTRLSRDPAEIEAASHVMLPGVGAFGAAMAALAESGADGALKARIGADRPTMCICVGHQLLFETSDESPGVAGLGVIPGHIRRFPDGVRVPQFGWNEVRANEGSRLLDTGYAYFANSYRAAEGRGFETATATHGGSFVAAVERGRVVGCQFHPELSSYYGEALLSRFVELS